MSLVPLGFWGGAEVALINQTGLILFQDALDPASYAGTGVNWTDTINSVTGQLQNGPVWNSAGYFTFDGVNDQMEQLATNQGIYQFGSGDFTLSAWVYVPDVNEAWSIFGTKASTGFEQNSFGFGETQGFGLGDGKKLYFIMLDSDASDGRAVSSQVLTGLNNWVNMTWVRNGGRDFKMFANGVLLTNTPTSNFGSATFNFSSGANWLFSQYTGNSRRFNNKVSILYMYNRSLSDVEVLANYDVHKSRFEGATGNPIVDTNLILHWDAGNVASYSGSGNSIQDLKASNYDGTLIGPVYSSGKFVSVESENDWINSIGTTVGSANVGTSDFTAEVWVRANNVNQASWLWSNRSNSSGSQFSITCGSPDDNGNVVLSKRFGGFLFGGGVFRSFRTNVDFVDGGWKHVALTRSGSTELLYINGLSVPYTFVQNIGSGTANVLTSTTWRSGDNGSGNGSFALDGDTSIYRLYNKSLSSVEVSQNFDAEKSRYGL